MTFLRQSIMLLCYHETLSAGLSDRSEIKTSFNITRITSIDFCPFRHFPFIYSFVILLNRIFKDFISAVNIAFRYQLKSISTI